MDEEIYRFEMPISTKDLMKVEEMVRKTDALTFFDASFNLFQAFRYRLEEAKYGTKTRALLDLNCFKDILSLGREDRSRSADRRKEAAALCLFFQCASIDLEPGFALHESPNEATNELTLFRRIDTLDACDLMKVMKGEWSRIPQDRLDDMPIQRPEGDLHRTIYGELGTEIALLKLACLIRSTSTPAERLEKFLRWSLDEFIFVREPVLLAFHQLTGNLPKSILKDINSPLPSRRLGGIKNALWDMLLLREWRRRLDEQNVQNRLWLLCTRDATVARLARKLVIVEGDDDMEELHRENMLAELWGKTKARQISRLYQDLVAKRDLPSRIANQTTEVDWQLLRTSLRESLIA